MDKQEFEVIDGSFIKTIFKNDRYMVSRFETDEGIITVEGPCFDYIFGDKYTLTGNYFDHPKYGFEFHIVTIKNYIPTRKDEIIKFLSSSAFKGVGKKAASKIYSTFGDESLKIISEDISVLDDIGLTEKQIESVKNGIESLTNDNNEVILLLISAGFSNSEANRIYYHYKDQTPYVLKDNPYRLYYDIEGLSYNKILQCAKGLEFEDKEIKFKQSYLIYLFKQRCFSNGDIYLFKNDFQYDYANDYDDFEEILDMCIKDSLITLVNDRYYLTSDYNDEKTIRDYLLSNNESLIKDDVNVESKINDYENEFNIKFDKYQVEAIKLFFKEDFLIINGGPGTGKTSLIKAIVNMFKDFFTYQNIIVVAPTGRAAKRINEMCEVESKTIHSLLKWNKETNSFAYNKKNPILYDCLIIDEFSMVDNNLFASLLKASSYVKKICVIGDSNQLPSIRPGNLLNDLINSNRFPIALLKMNHRQKEGNDIISLAGDIVNNKVNFDLYKSDVEFCDINSFDYEDLIQMIDKDIDDGYEFNDISVLSPMYKYKYGINNLNTILQKSFNPHRKNSKERIVGNNTYRVDDKILQLKNRPNDDVYNGDIGILEDIDDFEKTLVVDYQNVKVFYSFDDLDDITLAYSLSVHKSQGSEYKIVYFICCKEHINMLNKKLIYTAISRAKSKLVIIGDKDVFISAINKDINKRKTSLFMVE